MDNFKLFPNAKLSIDIYNISTNNAQDKKSKQK